MISPGARSMTVGRGRQWLEMVFSYQRVAGSGKSYELRRVARAAWGGGDSRDLRSRLLRIKGVSAGACEVRSSVSEKKRAFAGAKLRPVMGRTRLRRADGAGFSSGRPVKRPMGAWLLRIFARSQGLFFRDGPVAGGAATKLRPPRGAAEGRAICDRGFRAAVRFVGWCRPS